MPNRRRSASEGSRGPTRVRRTSDRETADAVLVRLARLAAGDGVSRERTLREYMQSAAVALEVGRAGLWLFTDDQLRLRCLHLYERERDRHSSGAELDARRYPAYFAALREARQIDAADAVSDPRTSEFAKSYLEPLTIGAMLDAPIRLEGELRGVVCFEHLGGVRPWSDVERGFAAAVADLLALALETERLRATQARLLDSEERFRAMFECAPLGMMLLDHDGDMLMVNDPMAALLGVPAERLLRRSYLDHVAPDDEAVTRRCIDDAKTCITECASVEHRLRPSQTSPREVRLTVAPATTLSRSDQLVAIVEDVSIARRAERAERQARQREAVSRLASGVAHDFRNVLTALRLTTQSLLEETPEDAPWRREMEELEQDASRAIELVRQLLALGRDEPHAPVPIDLGDFLRSELGMLRRLAGGSVSVVLELRRTLPPVYADHAGLQRVVLNLVTNARDAMPEGGTITITTDGPDESGFVSIEVRDTGPGFADDVAQRIFEPFFSTKVLGHGSGLGLATAQSIVDRNGGRIEAESIAGEGAVFRVYLPAAEPGQRR